jgi:hypothetical protein
MSLGCKVCDNLPLRDAIDKLLKSGKAYTYISRNQGYLGNSITPDTISKHDKHRWEYEANEAEKPAVAKRDLAVLVRDKMYDAIESMPVESMLIKDFQPALGNAIRAQGAIDKRETKKVGNQTFILQLAAALGERIGITAGPEVIEGEATELV